MKRILKFPLEIVDIQDVVMPVGADILHIGYQRGNLCLWAVCDTTAVGVRNFEILGTGNPINPTANWQERKFIGTAVGDTFVWHVFELVRKKNSSKDEA